MRSNSYETFAKLRNCKVSLQDRKSTFLRREMYALLNTLSIGENHRSACECRAKSRTNLIELKITKYNDADDFCNRNHSKILKVYTTREHIFVAQNIYRIFKIFSFETRVGGPFFVEISKVSLKLYLKV